MTDSVDKMNSDKAKVDGETPESEKKLTGLDWWINEAREMVMTIVVLLPFWVVFTSLAFELRVIPSESMVPTLLVGDRVAVSKYAYGYNRYSPALGIGRWFTKEDKTDPEQRMLGGMPQRGDVVVFQHPNTKGMVLIKRLIGMPGDTIVMEQGRLFINGEPVQRELVRRVRYRQKNKDPMQRGLVDVNEYRETLPNGVSYLTHDIEGRRGYDNTPVFKVPEGHYFMMGDNRDNSEDSRAPEGYPEFALENPHAWDRSIKADRDPTIGFVPLDHLLGRADTVLFTLYSCRKSETTVCFKPRLWSSLKDK